MIRLAVAIGIADGNAEQKAVELRFGQRVGPGIFDRILCREHHERIGQRVCETVDRDLKIVHRFQQRGLRARRGAVDFIGEHDVREKRAGMKFELVVLLIVYRNADDVGRQQIGRELDALESAVDRLRQRSGEHRFSDTGDVLDQHMTAREQTHEHVLDCFPFSNDGGFDILDECAEFLRGEGRGGGRAGKRGRGGHGWGNSWVRMRSRRI